MRTIRVTTVAGNVWTGRVRSDGATAVEIVMPGGIVYRVPRFRVASIETL